MAYTLCPMSDTKLDYNISRGDLCGARTKNVLSKSRVEQVIDEVYDQFSGDAPIQSHLIEFSAWHQLNQATTPNLSALHRFEYLKAASAEASAIRTKGFIALNMIHPVLDDGELSAYLVEPFVDIEILPELYRRWRAQRDGWSKPPLCL